MNNTIKIRIGLSMSAFMFRRISHPGNTRLRRMGVVALSILSLAVLIGLPTHTLQAAVFGGYSEYYIPGPEDDIWNIQVDIDNQAGDPLYLDNTADRMHSIISITASGDNTVVYYDHWENGYGFDPDDPENTYDQKFTLQAGEFLSLKNRVGNPNELVPVTARPATRTEQYYDGADRFYVAGNSVAVSRSCWPGDAAVLTTFALSWEVYPIKPFLTEYTIPVGEDLDASKGYADFEQTYVLVMSTEDNNIVQIDEPDGGGGYGAVDQINTLNRGQTTTRHHIDAGTRIIAQKPVQVQFIVANSRGHFEMRGFVAVPDNLWDNEYYNPVNGDGSGGGYDTDLYIYNPNLAPIIVRYEDLTGTGIFSVPSRETVAYSGAAVANRFVPSGSGVHLSSDDVFWAIGSGDTESTSMDWGFSLLPANLLTDDYYLGWAPGSNDLSLNGSPAFVTAVNDETIVNVDLDGNGSTDATYTLDRLETLTLRDLSDNDNSGMHISASGPLAVVWGIDPDVSDPYNPYLDLGAPMLPFPADWIDLTLSIAHAITPSVVGPITGEVSSVTLTVNSYDFPVNGVSVTDLLPADWSYIPGTVTITLPGGTTITGSSADPVTYTSGGQQVLEWTNSILNDLNMVADQELTITFDIQTSSVPAIGTYEARAQAVGYRLEGTHVFTPFDSAFINVTAVTIDKDVAASSQKVSQGGQATYTIRVENITNSDVTAVRVEDFLPTGFTYAGGSTTFVDSDDSGGATVTRTSVEDPPNGDASPEWGVWTLTADAWIEITFTADVDPAAPPRTYDNRAAVTGSFGALAIDVDDKGTTAQDLGTPEGADPEDDEDVTVYLYSLEIDKDRAGGQPSSISPGDSVQYLVKVTNSGNASVSNIRVTDPLPPGFTYVSTASVLVYPGGTPLSYTLDAADTTTPKWASMTLASGQRAEILFTATVAETTAAATYDNTALAEVVGSSPLYIVDDSGAVGQDADTPVGEDPEDDEDITVTSARLTIDKDAVTPSAVAGSTNAVYTIRVENTGGGTAGSVQITDNLLTAMGAGFTFSSATVTVSAGVSPADYASLETKPSSGATNLIWGNWTIPAGGWVELELTVAVGSGVTAGTYDNTAGASHLAGSSTIAVDDDGLAAQDADTPDFADAEDDEDIYVYAAGDDRVDLTIDILEIDFFTYDLVNAYVIQVSNNGPSTETGTIEVAYTLPAGLLFDDTSASGGWNCTVLGQDITCTNETDLAAGQTLPNLYVTIAVEDYEGGATQYFSSDATVSGTIPEIILGAANNNDTEPFAAKYPDLSNSTKTVEDLNGGSVEPGDKLQYTIEIIESGGRAAPQVSVDDIIQGLPLDWSSFEWVSVPTGATTTVPPPAGSGLMTVSSFTVPANSTQYIIYNISVDAGAVAGQTIDNTADIDNPQGPDATVDAPTLIVSAPPTPAAGNKPLYLYEDQSLSRTPPPTENFVIVANGGSKTWTLAPATQQALTIDGASGVISVALNLRAQDFGVHNYDVTVTLASAGDTVLTIGSVSRTVGLDNPSVSTEIFNVPVTGDISLTAGSRVTVTVAQTNANAGSPPMHVFTNFSGATENSRVELISENVIGVDSVKFYDDAYPNGAELLYTSPGETFYVRAVVSDPFGSYDISGATISLLDSEGFLAVSDATMLQVVDSGAATKTYEYAYTVSGSSGATNWTATVTADEGTEGEVSATGTGTLEESPTTGADLSITKSHAGNFAVGQNHDFTLTIKNFGPENQLNSVTVTDTLPTGLTYVSSTYGAGWSTTASPGDNPVTWTRSGTLYSGDSEDIVITVAVDSGAIPSKENEATVSLGDGENHPANNTARDTVYVSQLQILKSSNALSPYYPDDLSGNEISYTAVVTNNGQSPVFNVKVVDPLPPDLTYVDNSTQVTTPERIIRVKEYFIGAGDFSGTSYDLTLDQNLASNYFVIIQGSDGVNANTNLGPNVNYAALTGDPFGTGELMDLAQDDVIRLTRGGDFDTWVGVVTVVECLNPASADGFQLQDVRLVTHSNADTTGTENASWSWTDPDTDRVMLLGGFNGAGCTTSDTTVGDTKVCHARIWPTGTNTISWTRDAGGASLSTAESTVMVVEWGSAWKVQRVRVLNTTGVGGPGADETDEYESVSLPESVDPAHTWVWGTGHTDDNGIGDASEGVLITLGDGVTVAGNAVAVGMDNPDDVDFTVYALENSKLAVDYRFHPFGNNNDLTVDVTVDSAAGERMALSYNGCDGTGTAYPRPYWSARYLDNDTIRLERRRAGQEIIAWVQGIDFSGFSGGTVTNPGHAPDDLVASTDGYSLLPGETMTVEYKATLTDPLNTGPVTNTAYASSEFFPDPAESSVTIDVRSIGVASFTDVNGGSKTEFDYSGATGEEIYLRVYDPDKNVDPNVRESISVTVENTDTGDTVTATLYETGTDTGDFAYTNPLLVDAASNTNSGAVDTVVAQLVNPETGLTEDVTLTETGPDTGIFTNNAFWIRYELPLESTNSDPDRLYVDPGSTATNLQLDYVDTAGDQSRDKSTKVAAVATLVVLSNFEAYSDGNQVIVAWETVSEVGTLGFNLLRLDEDTDRLVQVNEYLLVGLLHEPRGGIYRFVDAAAVPGSTYTYKLVEVERRGDQWTYGPFTVMVGANERYSALPAMVSEYDRTAHAPAADPPDPSVLRNLLDSTPASIVPGDTLKISVSSDDLYFLSKELLASHFGKTAEEVSGLIQQGQLALTNRGLAVPYMPAPGDAGLYFYGVGVDTVYTRENIYWLTQGDGVVMPAKANTGDIDGNGATDQVDANLALQILSGVVPPGIPAGDLVWRADIDASGTVGLSEALYAYQRVSGLRSDPSVDPGPTPSATEGVFPSSAHFEQDILSLEDYATDPRADFWAWEIIASGVPFGYDVFDDTWASNFTLQDADTTAGAGSAQVTVYLNGGSSLSAPLDHHARVLMNGTVIGDAFWDGIQSKSAIFSFDAALLIEGANTLSVVGVPDTGPPPGESIIVVDAFDLTYPRFYRASGNKLAVTGAGNTVISIRGFDDSGVYVFDITDSFKTRRVTTTTVDNPDGKSRVSFSPAVGTTNYLALNLSSAVSLTQAELQVHTPSSLKSTSVTGEYLMIVPFAFADNAAIEQLADHRRSQDFTAQVAVLEDIMDEFNEGIFDPEAIRDFLAYARDNWAIPPRYVVLVGDGTNDFRNGYGTGDNRVPPLLVSTPYGLRASDNRLADLDGDDGVPEMAIGRLPVSDITELENVVAKIIGYEKQPRANWQQQVLMLADNADTGPGNEFPTDSDAVASLVPNDTYSVANIYINDPPGTTIDVSRDALFAAIDSGVFLLNYIGHGGYDRLADEKLLIHSFNPAETRDVDTMINGSRLPIAAFFSCIQGRFELPGYDSLSESLLTHAGGGAAAVWSSGGLSVNHQARTLSEELFKAVFIDQKVRVGDAVTQALQQYRKLTGDRLLPKVYNFFGDPAMKMPLVRSSLE